MPMRRDGRTADQLRPVNVTRGFTKPSPGSVLFQCGGTVVLCTASVSSTVPEWMQGRGTGWLTAEYNMLPGSTSPRKKRDRDGKTDGRTVEIQRLIGRSLRAIVDLNAIGERTIAVDCDVLQADGGTRTASITGAFIALTDALANRQFFPSFPSPPLLDAVAAVSVGLVEQQPMLDLDYSEDVRASVDMNLVMTAGGRFIEVQGTGEEATFSRQELNALLGLGQKGVCELVGLQRAALKEAWRTDLFPSGL